jgi:hypothetical protein
MALTPGEQPKTCRVATYVVLLKEPESRTIPRPMRPRSRW